MQAACHKFFQVSTFVESGHYWRRYEGAPDCPWARVSACFLVPAHIGTERTTAGGVLYVRLNHLQSAAAIDWLLLTPPRDSSFPSNFPVAVHNAFLTATSVKVVL